MTKMIGIELNCVKLELTKLASGYISLIRHEPQQRPYLEELFEPRQEAEALQAFHSRASVLRGALV